MLVFSTMPSQGHNKLFENIPEWSIFYHSHAWPLSVLFFSSTWQHCSNLLSCFAGGDLNYLIVSVIGTTNQHRRQLFIKTILTWLSHMRNNFQLLSTSPFAGKTKQIITNKSWMICYQAILIIWALLAFSLHFLAIVAIFCTNTHLQLNQLTKTALSGNYLNLLLSHIQDF